MLNVAVLMLSLTLLAIPANSQTRTAAPNLAQAQQLAAAREALSNVTPSGPPSIEQMAMAHAIAERRAQLRTDTEKLVALTAELKQHVDKAGANILSMEVVKKAQEIQKLAKSVQDKMKYAY